MTCRISSVDKSCEYTIRYIAWAMCATMHHKEQVTATVLPMRDDVLSWLRNSLR